MFQMVVMSVVMYVLYKTKIAGIWNNMWPSNLSNPSTPLTLEEALQWIKCIFGVHFIHRLELSVLQSTGAWEALCPLKTYLSTPPPPPNFFFFFCNLHQQLWAQPFPLYIRRGRNAVTWAPGLGHFTWTDVSNNWVADMTCPLPWYHNTNPGQ